MISTRGRYAVRILLDLIEHADEGWISLRKIAERQDISLKYIERILPSLREAGIVTGLQGKTGGYRLNGNAEDITVWDVLVLTEGDMAPVACLRNDAEACEHCESCRTLPMWNRYYDITREFFQGITLKDLLDSHEMKEQIT